MASNKSEQAKKQSAERIQKQQERGVGEVQGQLERSQRRQPKTERPVDWQALSGI